MHNFTLHNPTKVLFGKGMLDKLGEEVSNFGENILLMYGGGSIKRTGTYDKVMEQLKGIGANVFELGGVEPNPRVTTVRKGIEICRKENVDLVLAVGGGSVIDAAKAVIIGVPYEGDVWDFFEGKATPESALPLATVLTLAATGSEMNANFVISNWEEQKKRGYSSPHTYPKFSILDPTLTYTLPREQTVNGIIDSMSHVFEHYFNPTKNAPLQERLCESVLQTIIENGEIALEQPENYEARANLMWCSTMALNGIINAGFGGDWATHDIEHEISAIYDIPHAVGLSIVFPNWMKYVYKEFPERFAQYAERVWNIDPEGKTVDELALAGIQATRDYFTRIGAPATLKDINIGDEHFDQMAKGAVHFGPLGSMKRLEAEDVRKIYEMCL